jgi:digeranylgeranylglycerophospholipid reductase
MAKKYDVVIVGGGPAGLMAARVAGENGLKTALLERKTDITKIRRIDGGILSPINEYTFGQILTFNPKAKKIGFPECGFSIGYDGPYRDLYGFNIYSPGGKKITFGDREKQRTNPEKYRMAVALDKGLMLKGLLEEAEKNGADIFTGTNVTGIEKKGDSVEVVANGEVFEGRFVIAADGVNSRIARLMGLNKERRFFATHQEYAMLYEGVDIPEIEGIGFIFTTYGSFYVSTCCYDKQYHVGITRFKPDDNLPDLLNRFVNEDPVYSKWFQGGRKVEDVSCVINMMEPMEVPFKDNVIFVGDAAWLMEVTNAAAICCGWKAANAVTLAFLDGKMNRDGISSYLDFWKKYFYDTQGSSEFKPLEFQDFLDGGDLDYLAGLIKEPLIPTMDFYTMTTTIGSIFGELFPVIQEERPDVMDKMMGMVNRMEEEEEAARKAGFPNK